MLTALSHTLWHPSAAMILANAASLVIGCPASAQVENALRRSGHKYCTRMEVETPTLCMELARRELGYTVMPACAVHDGSRDSQTGCAPIRGLGLVWSLHVNLARQHSVAVRALTLALREFVARQISSGKWPFATLITGNRVTGRSI
jgi:DNA-binding transcriptional LysR family regulator